MKGNLAIVSVILAFAVSSFALSRGIGEAPGVENDCRANTSDVHIPSWERQYRERSASESPEPVC